MIEHFGMSANIYYNPEKVGVTLLGSLEDPDACYEYSTVIVVQDNESKKVYAAHDSGCSCPTPFEDYHSEADLTELRSVEDYEAFVLTQTYTSYDQGEKVALARRIKEALNA